MENNFDSRSIRDRAAIPAYSPEAAPQRNKLDTHKDGTVIQTLDPDGAIIATRTVVRPPEPQRIVPQAPLTIADAISLIEQTGDKIVEIRDAYAAQPFLADRSQERQSLAHQAFFLREELAKVESAIAEIDGRVPPSVQFKRAIVQAENETIGAIRLAKQAITHYESEKRFGLPLSRLSRANTIDLQKQTVELDQFCNPFAAKLTRTGPDNLDESQVKARVPSLLQGLEAALLELRTRLE